MQIAAVILAAGASTRFGSPKQIVRLSSGRTMLEAVTEIAREAGLTPIIAVVPRDLAVPPDLIPELNDAPEEGMSRSLQRGLAAVPAECDGAVVLLGDQPTLPIATIRALVDRAGRTVRPVVTASAGGRIGPPVLLLREAFVLADAATGDEGLRSILARHPELVVVVEVGEHAPDVDTPDDLERIG